ncbi:AAA family ATPase [Novipirellula artificiosorum]|uniref:Regulatory protein RepA n=1 Tax=Novipirellula artificiosorum TaxID=2528016 RepID=A0A5C6DP53_9BACT|nr:AAA family ATPase [Novipirellula artificiosorum]TWU38580.1 Regulatory protein RepA [Novipirellula artificiosorum]
MQVTEPQTIESAGTAEYPIQNIPPSLLSVPQWVCWRSVIRDNRPTKEPIDPRNGRLAKTNDPSTWSDFEKAWDRFESSHGTNGIGLNGIGFVFTADDPFAGVDIDDCLAESGEYTWGADIVSNFDTYAEVSPSGTGVKLFLCGAKPSFAQCRKEGFGPLMIGKVEVYDQGRFFTVTGKRLSGSPADVQDCQGSLDELCEQLWPPSQSETNERSGPQDAAFDDCLAALLKLTINDHNDGSHRLYVSCCRCVEHDLSDEAAIRCIRQYTAVRPFPKEWSDAEIAKRLRDAEKTCRRGEALGTQDSAKSRTPYSRFTPQIKPVGDLLNEFPVLREPIIDGLLRVGETMNVIAPPKLGKSWLVMDLAMAVATGRIWLDTYQTHQGNVLLLDNELHSETSASRIPRVASARGIQVESLNDSMFIDNLRGRLPDINSLDLYFDGFTPGFFKMVILDAFYRFMPKDTDENSNGNVTDLYNALDRYAAKLQCSFVLVHHASKGNQSVKSVTDVGAGAGSQSRATDTHLVLRHHKEADCVVVDAAVRSWPPIEPRCLRWLFPVWYLDDNLDPTDLKPERGGRKPKDPPEPRRVWTVESFVRAFVTEEPQTLSQVEKKAAADGEMSKREARELRQAAEDEGLIYRWTFGAARKAKVATVPKPASESDW